MKLSDIIGQDMQMPIAETTSAGGVASVAQPMGSTISRKTRKNKRKKARENTDVPSEVELDEGSREWVIGALAAMGMLGGIAGLDHNTKQLLNNDTQMQTLVSYYEDAKEAGDREAMKQLKKRIHNHKGRLLAGYGPVMGADGEPIVPKRDSTTDARRSNIEETLHGNEFFEKYGWIEISNQLTEAEYQGRDVDLNKPIRSSNGPKKFHVYVNSGKKTKDGKIKVKKVNFGDPDMEIKRDDPEARKSFRARHNCDQKKDKTTAGYWSCKKW
jgi:hypothetical protein